MDCINLACSYSPGLLALYLWYRNNYSNDAHFPVHIHIHIPTAPPPPFVWLPFVRTLICRKWTWWREGGAFMYQSAWSCMSLTNTGNTDRYTKSISDIVQKQWGCVCLDPAISNNHLFVDYFNKIFFSFNCLFLSTHKHSNIYNQNKEEDWETKFIFWNTWSLFLFKIIRPISRVYESVCL